jgi:hypothetical protein
MRIMEVDSHHALRWTHEIAQGACGGQHDTGELGALLLRDAELRAPANSSPVTIPCLRATAETLVPGSSVSLAIANFSSSLKNRLAGALGAAGSPISAAVKRRGL